MRKNRLKIFLDLTGEEFCILEDIRLNLKCRTRLKTYSRAIRKILWYYFNN